MAKKNRYQYDSGFEEDDNFVSRSQKKRNSTALQTIGEELVELAPSQWAKLPLNDDILAALKESKNIRTKEAKRRHIQYIGRLMRESQVESEINGAPDIVEAYLEWKANS